MSHPIIKYKYSSNIYIYIYIYKSKICNSKKQYETLKSSTSASAVWIPVSSTSKISDG